MRRIYTAAQAAAIDKYSIEKAGIPSLVLMERAALAVTEAVLGLYDNRTSGKVLCVCGHGNNGADGLAVARQLNEKGIPADVFIAGDITKATEEFTIQFSIIKKLGIDIKDKFCPGNYIIIVDGIFGNGLEREVTGKYAEFIKRINDAEAQVVSIDVPSGTDATTGATLGISADAHKTVTFGREKTGLVFYPGAQKAGEVVTADIGFAPDAEERSAVYGEKCFYLLDDDELDNIPERKADTHKGSYGRVLIAAGSFSYGGAAVLCAKAALRTGAGIVKVFTHEENRDVLLSAVPEAIPVVYDDPEEEEGFEESLKRLAQEVEKADVTVVGPGLDTDVAAVRIADTVFENAKGILIADADALNIVSQKRAGEGITPGNFAKRAKAVVITPHVGEMAGLLGKGNDEIKADPVNAADEAAKKFGCTAVLKGARTIIAGSDDLFFVNAVGNPGMATAGSGDVLSGIIAGLSSMGAGQRPAANDDEIKDAARKWAYTGVYVHACAGDKAVGKKGEHSLLASDIIEKLPEVLHAHRL